LSARTVWRPYRYAALAIGAVIVLSTVLQPMLYLIGVVSTKATFLEHRAKTREGEDPQQPDGAVTQESARSAAP
jgi:hypothetical protein